MRVIHVAFIKKSLETCVGGLSVRNDLIVRVVVRDECIISQYVVIMEMTINSRLFSEMITSCLKTNTRK
jgi:hypothetical protein